MKKVILYISALAILCGSCSQREVSKEESVEAAAVSLDPMIQSRMVDDSFEVGDQIALTISMSDNTLYAENSLMSYDGDIFSGSLLWYDEMQESSTLTAYFPYVEGASLPTSFTIEADQSSADSYAASDLMIAQRSGVFPSSSSTLMTFNHIFCSMVVSVDNRSDQGVESLSIGGTLPTADLNILDCSVEVDSASQSVDIETLALSDGSFNAIFVPQSAALTFKVTLEDGTIINDEVSYQEFEQGMQYAASILILDGGISVTISSAIEQWGDGGDIEITEKSSFEEFDTYFIYDGVSYNIATFSNGLTVMVDNMRYIPEGMTPSSDPSDGNGLWYTYSLSPDPGDASADYIATVLTDDESVAKYGYLYNFATAFGVDVTGENYDKFEGVQGICPDGWHIPTQAEWHSLSGDGYGASDDSSAPFYDSSVGYGSIQLANQLGFNHTYPGAIANDRYTTSYVASDYTDSDSEESIVGKNSLSYYMSSTAQTYWESSDKACYYALYTSHASAYTAKGCISVMLSYEPYGVSLRCVKDN